MSRFGFSRLTVAGHRRTGPQRPRRRCRSSSPDAVRCRSSNGRKRRH